MKALVKKILGKTIKALGHVAVFLFMTAQSYFISLWLSGVLFVFTCSIWSFVGNLPEYIVQHFGMLFLIISIPLAVVVFIYLAVNLKKEKKTDDD